MKDLTDILTAVPNLDLTFHAGIHAARAGIKPVADYAILATVRERHGFQCTPAPLLTPPGANTKLDAATVPSYGLTLFHFRLVLPAVDGLSISGMTRMHRGRITLNACPNAGHCVKVCVLNNGHGRWDSTRRAWAWRTDFLARHTESFVRVLAWELVRAVAKHGAILFRPNVNSDVAWERVLPSLTDGYLQGVTSYGYSKRPDVLATDGWLGTAYRVAYSWNEKSDAADVRAFLARGGSVAVVTARRKGESVLSVFPFGTTAYAVDADITDEWLLQSGTVGDLSAKGKARELIGRSKFVVNVDPSLRNVTVQVAGPRRKAAA